MSIREITPNFHIFARNISHRFPSFLIAFAQICPLLLPEFPLLLLPEFRGKAMGNSGKTNGKFWQKQWENLGKTNASESGGIYFGQKLLLLPEFLLLFPEFPIAFSRISHCFARISHCFCPNFSFSNIFLGGTVPPPPPPPTTPMNTYILFSKKNCRQVELVIKLIFRLVWVFCIKVG